MSPLETALAYATRANDKYRGYRDTQAAIEQYEDRIVAQCGGNKIKAAELLSGERVPKDWTYKQLTGARNGLQQQMQVEIEMATMHAAIAAAMAGGTR